MGILCKQRRSHRERYADRRESQGMITVCKYFRDHQVEKKVAFIIFVSKNRETGEAVTNQILEPYK
jgi:hypothetical protein